MKFEIYSKNHNLIVIGENKEFEINDNKIITEKTGDFFIKIYPLFEMEKCINLPYTAKIKFENDKYICENKNIFCTQFQNHCEIKINNYKIYKPQVKKLINEYNFNHNNENHTVCIYENSENNFILKSSKPIFETTIEVKSCTIFHLNDFIIINYENNKNNLMIFNIKTLKIELDINIEQFEINTKTNTLFVIEKFNDSLNHGKVYSIDLNTDYKILENYLTYLDDKQINNVSFNEYIFFDCVKVENFKKARTFLTNDLNNMISNEALIKYFENYKEIKSTLTKNQFYLLPIQSNQKAKLVEFEKNDNLINNIKMLYK